KPGSPECKSSTLPTTLLVSQPPCNHDYESMRFGAGIPEGDEWDSRTARLVHDILTAVVLRPMILDSL
ncbi:hypothetical protein P7K49_009311, partial [Saguinus oedipus]